MFGHGTPEPGTNRESLRLRNTRDAEFNMIPPLPPALEELLVALGPSEDHVNPYPHRLGRGGHQVVGAVVRFHAESQLGVGAFHCAHVVHVHLRDGLEVDAPSGLRLRLVRVVEQAVAHPVKHEPALAPAVEPVAHLGQEALAAGRGDAHVAACLHSVAGRLYVLPQVKLLLPDRQVPSQRSSLQTQYIFMILLQ